MKQKHCSRCPETRPAEFRRGDRLCRACRRAYNRERKRELRRRVVVALVGIVVVDLMASALAGIGYVAFLIWQAQP